MSAGGAISPPAAMNGAPFFATTRIVFIFWNKEGAILGTARFVRRMAASLKGDRQEQRAAARLRAQKVTLSEVFAAVEKAKGRRWETFRDRHGDGTRDMILCLGRRRCGMKLTELGASCGPCNYGSVAMAIGRYERRLAQAAAESRRMNEITQMLNVKM